MLIEYDTENHTEKFNHTETTLKNFTKDNQAETSSLISLKYVTYCYSRNLSHYNPIENYSITYILCSLNQRYSGFSV